MAIALLVVALSAASCGGSCAQCTEMIEPPEKGTVVKLFFDDGEFVEMARVSRVDLPSLYVTSPDGLRLVIDWRHVRGWSSGVQFDEAWANAAK